nr:hypothetical protein [uncultured Lichenicoccus sp.]
MAGPDRRSVLRAVGAACAGFAASAVSRGAHAHGTQSHSLILGAGNGTPAGGAMPNLIEPAMMVAGPSNSAAAGMARMLAPLLSGALHSRPVAVSAIGGRDGVTGANTFEALTNPDGATALLVPGAACMAWLAGDPRVHFDAGRWVPALTGFGSAAFLARSQPREAGAPLRVAASTAAGPELAALLGLSLLGIHAVPVFGLAEYDDAMAAYAAQRVDAILLTGSTVPDRMRTLSAGGLRPIFSLGVDGGTGRDPALAGIPTLPELHMAAASEPALLEAWRATAAAARLHAAVVLPQLTPASLVAQWRGACRTAMLDPAAAATRDAAQLTLLPAPGCVAALASMVADENTLLTLRRWLASRTDWRPA